MSKYCEQCGKELDDHTMFCSECGVKCTDENSEVKEEAKKNLGNKNKKKIFLIGIGIFLVGFCIIGNATGFFSDFKKGYEEAEDKLSAKSQKSALTEDGKAYKMTVQEYCDRFNEMANESWCSGDEEIFRMEVYEGTLDSLQEAAAYDSEVEELMIQTMTPQMILGTTLLESEDADEFPSGENYLRYTYTNQYSFIPANVGVQILALKDTNQIVGIAAQFPMNYRNVGDRFGKLICDSFGEDTDEFQELYLKMKEAGGYGHMYKDGTVFELMYYNNSEQDALFKMSACTKEHYVEAWVNNPDLPSKENPIENSEEGSEISSEENEETSNVEINDTETGINEGSGTQQNEILEMFDNLIFYEGTWGDFGSHVNEYQGMVENAIKSSISLSDYFGDVNGTYMILEKRVLNDDVLENGQSATNQLYTITFEGPSVTGTGGTRYLDCTVSSLDGVNLVYNEISYY